MQERRRRIVDQVLERGKISVEELSRMFDCSLVTIRSDLKALQDQGKIMRSRGYALRTDFASFQNNQKNILHKGQRETGFVENISDTNLKRRKAGVYKDAEKKQRIAQLAYSMIDDNDMIIIDESSTTFYLTRVCPFDDVDTIITDDSIGQKYIDMADKRGISLKIAE